MLALDRKLWRDLVNLRGQAFAIAAVMASGFACYLMFLSTLDSLQLSRESYYRDYRFAEIFAPLKRAPESVRQRIAEIKGVDKVLDAAALTYVAAAVAAVGQFMYYVLLMGGGRRR